jgi:hypothetical protein
MSVLLLLLASAFTKELIIVNQELIINITFLSITVIFVNYFSFLKDTFEQIRASYKNNLQIESVAAQQHYLSNQSQFHTSIVSLSRLTNSSNHD